MRSQDRDDYHRYGHDPSYVHHQRPTVKPPGRGGPERVVAPIQPLAQDR